MNPKKWLVLSLSIITIIVSSGYAVGYYGARQIKKALNKELSINQARFIPGEIQTEFGFFSASAQLSDSVIHYNDLIAEIPSINARNSWTEILIDAPTALLKKGPAQTEIILNGIHLATPITDLIERGKVITIDLRVGSLVLEDEKIKLSLSEIQAISKHMQSPAEGEFNYQIGLSELSLKKADGTQPQKIISLTSSQLKGNYRSENERIFLHIETKNKSLNSEKATTDIALTNNNLKAALDLSAQADIIKDLPLILKNIHYDNYLGYVSQYDIQVHQSSLSSDLTSLETSDIQCRLDSLAYTFQAERPQKSLEMAKAKGELKGLSINSEALNIQTASIKISGSSESNPQAVSRLNSEFSSLLKNQNIPALVELATNAFKGMKMENSIAYSDFSISIQSSQLKSPKGQFDMSALEDNGQFRISFKPQMTFSELDQIEIVKTYFPIKQIDFVLEYKMDRIQIAVFSELAKQFPELLTGDYKALNPFVIGFSGAKPSLDYNLNLKTDQQIQLDARLHYELMPFESDFDVQKWLMENQADLQRGLRKRLLAQSDIQIDLRIDEYKALLDILDKKYNGMASMILQMQLSTFLKNDGSALVSNIRLKDSHLTVNDNQMDQLIQFLVR